ncbi:ABC transporter permease [Gallaecimonas kandeliae]|uniref:ABC transporter permease n=1 Tax=Gallaecimonas kandeliae TaxID=3029055 RepID=UPI002649D0CD|nr:ABC transporter permease [Gallaecimonas kandeliae]WKE65899.1 ABC transporter permease [Gallaecimonas kandeliae]
MKHYFYWLRQELAGFFNRPLLLLTLVVSFGLTLALVATVAAVSQPLLNRGDLLAKRDNLYVLDLQADMGGMKVPFSVTNFYEPFSKHLGRDALAVQKRETLMEGKDGDSHPALAVSANYFKMLEVVPVLGRGFGPDSAAAGELILSHDFWEKRWHGDPAVLGKSLTLGGKAYRIIGVAPAELVYPKGLAPKAPELFLSLPAKALELSESISTDDSTLFLAKLAVGSPLDELTTTMLKDLGEVFLSKGVDISNQFNLHMKLAPISDRLVSADDKLAVAVLAISVAILLMISLSNLGHLLLIHQGKRHKDEALHQLLGGHWWQRLLVFAGCYLVLFGLSTLMGLWLGQLLLGGAQSLFGGAMQVLKEARLNAPAMAMTAAIALAAALLLALLSGLQGWKLSLAASLQQSGKGGGGRLSGRRQQWMNLLQVAMSCLLLVGLWTNLSANLDLLWRKPAMAYEHRYLLNLQLDEALAKEGGKDQSMKPLLAAIEQVVGTQPGIEASQLGQVAPYSTSIQGLDITTQDGESLKSVAASWTGPGFVDFYDIELLAGRAPKPADYQGDLQPLVVTKGLADKLARTGNGQVLGRRLSWTLGKDKLPQQGQVLAVINSPLAEMGINNWMLIPPMPMGMDSSLYLAIKSQGQPDLKQLEQRLKDALPVVHVETESLAEVQKKRLEPLYLKAGLALFTSALTLMVMALSLFGNTSFSVQQRSHDLGIRQALGASDGQLLRHYSGQGLWSIFWGALAGLGLGVAGYQWARQQLEGLPEPSWPGLVALALILLLIATTALLVPVRQLLKKRPMTLLREL